ncbi:MAG: potassium channel family protein [Pseudomonadota bacterium]
MRDTVRTLYMGTSERSRRFRFGLLAFDLVTIAFFVVTSVLELQPWVIAVDLVIGILIAIDLGLRIWISESPMTQLRQTATWIDVVVILSLLLPTLLTNLLFLRVLRALRLLRSYHVLRELRQEIGFFRRNEEVIQSAVNLGVFVFIMTALVYVVQHPINPKIETYIDALYFTIAALTTTGFGDITLIGTSGKILAVLIMILGVALFLRLVQTIFRPTQVRHACPDCGLQRHDADAVHCKHCGRVLNIPNEGRDA